MCYAKPGPRCTAHARADLQHAQEAWDTEPSEANFTALEEAQRVYDSTPGGQEALQEQIVQSDDPSALTLRLEAGKMMRADQMTKMMTSTYGFPAARSVRRGINSPDDVGSVEAVKSLIQESESWRDSLPEKEEFAVHWYSMHGFESVNAALRGGWSGEEFLAKKNEMTRLSAYAEFGGYENMVKQNIDLIDSALNKAPRTPEPRILYRSITIPRAGDQAQALDVAKAKFAPGQTVTFPSYLSTSVDSDLMVYNAHRHNTKPEDVIVFEMLSSRGVSMQGKGLGSIQNHEREVLMPRDSKMKVVKILDKVTFESTRPLPGRYNSDGWLNTFARLPKRARVTVVQLVDITDE